MAAAPPPPGLPPNRPNISPMSRLNRAMATLIALLAVLSAIPVASARPILWLIWSGAIALVTLYWLMRAARLAPDRRMQSRALLPGLLLAGIVPLYAVLQSIALPPALPGFPPPLRAGLEALSAPAISVLPDASWLGALRFAAWILLFILVTELSARRERVQRITAILFTGIALQAIWALIALRLLGDMSLFREKSAYIGSATGTFVNRNSLATYLGFGLVLGAGMLARRLTRPQTRHSRSLTLPERLELPGLLTALGMVMIFLALVATQSRLGLLASLTGLLVTVLLLLRQAGRLGRRALLAGGLFFLALVVLMLLLGQGGISNRLLMSEVNLRERLALYGQILGMIRTRPLSGFGFDAFAPAFEAFRAPPLGNSGSFLLAHNSYLMLWSELGLIIGSIPILLLAIAGVILLRRLREGEDFPIAAAAAFGALVIAAVHSLGDFSLEIPANVFVFTIILALGLARRTRGKARTSPVAGGPVADHLTLRPGPRAGSKGNEAPG